MKRFFLLLAGVVCASLVADVVEMAGLLMLVVPRWATATDWAVGFALAFVPSIVLCLPIALWLGRKGKLTWWACPAIGIMAAAGLLLATGSWTRRMLIEGISMGATGGLAFYPFWRWAERHKESGESR